MGERGVGGGVVAAEPGDVPGWQAASGDGAADRGDPAAPSAGGWPRRQRRPPCAAPNRPPPRCGHGHVRCLPADSEQFASAREKYCTFPMFFLAVCNEGFPSGTAGTEPQSPLASWHSPRVLWRSSRLSPGLEAKSDLLQVEQLKPRAAGSKRHE